MSTQIIQHHYGQEHLESIEAKTHKPITAETKARVHALTHNCFNPDQYEYNFDFKKADPKNPFEAHTTVEMLEALDQDPRIELEARVLCATTDGQLVPRRLNKKEFKESFIQGDKKDYKFREGMDGFLVSNAGGPMGNGLVGQDFTPLLGGPFFKNLYYYTDYIRMHSEAFFAQANDPVAKAFLNITRDFVLGTGFSVECDTSDDKGKLAMAIWNTFDEANDFQHQIDQLTYEIGVYGEVMTWWLPNNQTKIVYQLNPNNTIPKGIIPRVRLLDPSNMVEIVTYPEDITRKLFYVWLTPSQWQIYTTANSSNPELPQDTQPTLKYIYQQIPADQIDHYRINSVSNEKRGRSDLFPILSYLKRFRDGVNYSLIALQKASAWAIDTEINGSQDDINSYVSAMKALGTIPDAGSEWVHSAAVKRQYLGNSNASAGISDAMLYALSAACMGVQIPFNYLGSHLSSGTTRASAIVATEPVAKKMERRRHVIKTVIKQTWSKLMKQAGMKVIDCNVIFPEIITQDRSQKLQDLAFGQQQGWWSKQRAANAAAKEMAMSDYDYNSEQETMAKTQAPQAPANPLTAPGSASPPPLPALPSFSKGNNSQPGTSGLTSQDRSEVKQNDTSY